MMFLSVSLGIPFHDVRQWSAAELSLYAAYYRIAPWGEERADLRNGMQMAQTANMHRDRSSKAYDVEDFMPFHKRKMNTSADDMRKALSSMNK